MLEHNHNHSQHGTGADHPCVGPALWGSLLLTGALVALVTLTAFCCRAAGVARRRKKRGVTEHEAAHDYEEFWFSRLESGGLMILTVAAVPVFIEYARHPGEEQTWAQRGCVAHPKDAEGNIYWLLSSSCDVLGMFFICGAFIYEDTAGEVPM